MSKKKKSLQDTMGQIPPQTKVEAAPMHAAQPGSKNHVFALYFLLTATCVMLYANTLKNEYALDDAMMITQNNITQRGFEGIHDHITHSFLYGYMNQEGYDAASSHWRPLVMISYAMEVGLWGNDKPAYSHAVNIIIYIGIVLLLFNLLRKYIFKDNWRSFFTALLFAIHPVHTEVVANIKGRDELLCLLLILLCLHQLWIFVQRKKWLSYIMSLSLFFLAMATKENSLTFLAGIPVMLYFFSSLKGKKIAVYTAGFVVTAIVFVIIRNGIVPLSNSGMSDEITNNPYLYAQGSEGIATKIFVLLLYLKLLLFPHPLSYDYSYNHIPYVNAANGWVWISLIIYAGLFIYALLKFRSKSIISFAVLMFFITLSVSTNMVVETGVIMAERMLFIPSVFAMIFLVSVGSKMVDLIAEKLPAKKLIPAALMITPVLIACSIKTINRNTDWKNDNTLNLADVVTVPNSARVNGGAGTACITLSDKPDITKMAKDSLLRKAIEYYKKSVAIHPLYNDPWLNMGVAYSRLDSIFNAEACWNNVRKRAPQNPKLAQLDRYLAFEFCNRGAKAAARQSPDSAIMFFTKADSYCREYDSLKMSSIYQLAGTYYNKGDFKNAKESLARILKVNPNYSQARKGYEASEHFLELKGQK